VPPELYSRPSETATGSELERQLSICRECGTGMIEAWRAFPDDNVSRDCGYHVLESTTEAAFRVVAGWTDHELLLRGYHVASTLCAQPFGAKYLPLLSEVERRLGLDPVQPGPGYASPMVPVVTQALDVFRQHCVPWAPMIDERRLEAEHHSLQYGWGGPQLRTGSLAEITDVLREKLDGDATRPEVEGFRLSVRPSDYCVQVQSHLTGNRAYMCRIWRTPIHFALCESRKNPASADSG
jgi:hypothetical protein